MMDEEVSVRDKNWLERYEAAQLEAANATSESEEQLDRVLADDDSEQTIEATTEVVEVETIEASIEITEEETVELSSQDALEEALNSDDETPRELLLDAEDVESLVETATAAMNAFDEEDDSDLEVEKESDL